jgi:hypothetical protein
MSSQLSAMSARGDGGGGITVFTGEGRRGIITTLVIPTALGAGVLYVYSSLTGTSMSAWMYVSSDRFKKGMVILGSSIGQLGSALTRVRKELGERIDALSEKVSDGVDIAKESQKELGAMHEELARVGVDVAEMQRMTQDVEEKIDRVMAAQGVTNRGVRLLCSVFDEATGQQQQQRKAGRESPALGRSGGEGGGSHGLGPGRYLAVVDAADDKMSSVGMSLSSSSTVSSEALARPAGSLTSSGTGRAVSAGWGGVKTAQGGAGVSSSVRSEIGR